MKKLISVIMGACIALAAMAQDNTKVYDERLNPDTQIREAVYNAAQEGKYVVAQLGGNWCKWCILFARFVDNDPDIKQLVEDNFEFIHVNYNPRNPENDLHSSPTDAALRRLGNPVRFGYPVLVVLDDKGNVIHTQDSALLESGDGYDREKVIRFFSMWTPTAVNSSIMK